MKWLLKPLEGYYIKNLSSQKKIEISNYVKLLLKDRTKQDCND